MPSTATRPNARPRFGGWARLSPIQRRRIVLGSMMTLAVAARDVVLLMFAAGFFAISELTPAPRAMPTTGA